MSAKFTIRMLVILTGFIVSTARAQTAIPVGDYDDWWKCWSIRDRSVDMVVQDQVASVTVTDHVVNQCRQSVEVQYLFPLPPDAAIDQFTLVVDGRELTGHMLDANEARRIYNEIVRRQRDPGLLEYAGCGLYRSSAFPLPPGKSAELIVHYTATCKKDGDIVELWYPLSTGRSSGEPIGRFVINADIQSAGNISNVYSPSLDLDISRKSPDHVVARFDESDYRPLADFQLFYEASREDVGATFLTYWPDRTKDGYYLMMVSPSPRAEADAVQPKDIVIVLDRSGSMGGEKIEQARDAVRFVLNNLNRDDRFNFIAYNDNVTPCFESLLPATDGNINRALDRLDRTDANGGTNIYHALEVALSQFPSHWWQSHALETALSQFPSRWLQSSRPAYVIFLTDGLPTVGNTKENDILENTHAVNRANARVFTFGVGYDVNVRLLDKLVNQNHGRSAYVKPKESIETKVSALYTRIKNPYMTNVTVALDNFRTRDDCPAELGDLFENDQLIRVGRIYPQSEGLLEDYSNSECASTLRVSGELRGESHSFEYPIRLNLDGPTSSYRFVEKLWATRRVGQLLEEIQLHGRVNEVVDELIRLSKQYGIVTPYTSFLADEHQDLAASGQIRRDALTKLHASAESFSGPQAQIDASSRSVAMDMVAPRASMSPQGYAMKMGASSLNEYEAGISEEINTIRIVGNVTLYKKGDVWLTAETADLDPVHDLAKFTVIQRFSDEYFALMNDCTPDENKVLASQQANEKLGIRLHGQTYLIE